MRTKTIKLYKFNELSDDAKKKAIEHYRELVIRSEDIPWQHEILQSFKAVYETAGVRLKDYSLGLCSHSYAKIDWDHSDPVYHLSGARALGWIENNVIDKLRITRAEYRRNRKDFIRWRYRVGAVKSCPFTGVCYDDHFLETLQREAKNGRTLGDIFRIELPETYVRLLQAEYDYQVSDEGITDEIEANDREFLESGKLYTGIGC